MVILGVEGGEHRLRVHQDTSEGTIAAASRTKALQAIRSSPLYLMRVHNSRALVLRLRRGGWPQHDGGVGVAGSKSGER